MVVHLLKRILIAEVLKEVEVQYLNRNLTTASVTFIILFIMIIEMPPRLDNITKRPHYFRKLNLDKVQIKFNNSSWTKVSGTLM